MIVKEPCVQGLLCVYDVIHRLPRINEKGSGWTKLFRVIIVLKYYALESHTRGYARLIAKVWARGARGVVSGASR